MDGILGFLTALIALLSARWPEVMAAVTQIVGALTVLYGICVAVWDLVKKYFDLSVQIKAHFK